MTSDAVVLALVIVAVVAIAEYMNNRQDNNDDKF